ncbi:GMC family oxidoreductase [Aspergillus foveolatus]|uniref:GMC family oxidoreductase n=1 Tax=Aspergillus foveolatus TaxID=210207 RepID=UPI003CCCFDB1
MSEQEADIIIVGGGTAGLVLATRLSANPNLDILLLEAGQDLSSDPRTQTPAFWYNLLSTDADWGFNTEPQAALAGKRFRQPQGRQLGGSSGLNGMVFVANSRANVDAWGALGNEGWDWETLAPYYRKVFHMTLPKDPEKIKELGLEYVDVQNSSGSEDGLIQSSFPDALVDPSASAWVQTLRGLGYPMKKDPFSGEAVIGGYINAATIHPISKTRSYSANAYYLPVKGRTNLRVVTGAQVTRVMLERSSDGEGEPIATGVEYTTNSTTQPLAAKARREVILSAGAYNSPKLLELSGIGSPAILSQFGIPVQVANLHVGENLQDHAMAGVSFEVQDSVNFTLDDLTRQVPEALAAAMREYQIERSGPFTVGGFYSSALLPVPDFADPETGVSELEKVLVLTLENDNGDEDGVDRFALTRRCDFLRALLTNHADEATAAYFTYPAQVDFSNTGVNSTDGYTPGPARPENYITIFAMLLHPLSRGSTHITSASAADPPRIDPRYLSHPVDTDILARHVRFIDTIASAPPLSSLLKPGGKRSPGVPANLASAPLAEVAEYVRAACMNNYHSTGSCAMMPRERGGVVDARLRVWGVKGLRVVDASVLPIIPRGNIQSTVYALAERAVDLVLLDYA